MAEIMKDTDNDTNNASCSAGVDNNNNNNNNNNSSTSTTQEEEETNNGLNISTATDLSTQYDKQTTPLSKTYNEMLQSFSGPLDDVLNSMPDTPPPLSSSSNNDNLNDTTANNDLSNNIAEESDEFEECNQWPLQQQSVISMEDRTNNNNNSEAALCGKDNSIDECEEFSDVFNGELMVEVTNSVMQRLTLNNTTTAAQQKQKQSQEQEKTTDYVGNVKLDASKGDAVAVVANKSTSNNEADDVKEEDMMCDVGSVEECFKQATSSLPGAGEKEVDDVAHTFSSSFDGENDEGSTIHSESITSANSNSYNNNNKNDKEASEKRRERRKNRRPSPPKQERDGEEEEEDVAVHHQTESQLQGDVIGGENELAAASPPIASSSGGKDKPSSEKQRRIERRKKLRQQLQHKVALGRSIDSEESMTTATASHQSQNTQSVFNTSSEILSLPVVSAEAGAAADHNHGEEENSTTIIASFSDRGRREKRKLRQSSPTNSSNSSSNLNLKQEDASADIETPPPPHLPGDTGSSPRAGSPTQKSTPVSRREKIAQRVAKGKVSIPKALLQTPLHSKTAPAADKYDINDVSKSSNRSPKTPTISNKKSIPTTDNSLFPTTPITGHSAQQASPSQQRLIVTPTNEVEMKLIEEGDVDNHNDDVVVDVSKMMENSVSIPILDGTSKNSSSSSPNKQTNEARRNRRHLRKGPVSGKERVEMAFSKNSTTNNDSHHHQMNNDEESQERNTTNDGLNGEELPPVTVSSEKKTKQQHGFISDNVKSTLVNALGREKEEAEAEQHRSPSPTASSSLFDGNSKSVNPEVSAVIARALEKARRHKLEKDSKALKLDGGEEGTSIDNDEAKELFPMSLEQQYVINNNATTPLLTSSDEAWNVHDASERNALLEQTKSRNKESLENDDGRPLLHLETITSDNNHIGDHNDNKVDGSSLDGTTTSVISKLMSQKERMNMYINGGFGEGEDSSVDVDETDENENDDDGSNNNVGVEVTDNKVLFDYEDMNNMIDDDDDDDDNVDENDDDAVEAAIDAFHPEVRHDNVPTFSPGANEPSSDRVDRWNRNPDCMSDTSSFFDTNATATSGGRAMLGLSFVGSSSTHGAPQLRHESQLDKDATPKIGSSSRKASENVKLFKIAPPPPEKLREWEESKGMLKRDISSSDAANVNQDSPPGSGRQRSDSMNYKIHTPKSPTKKKPHTLEEEMHLANRPHFAAKVLMARAKAEKKFEEEYAHHPHSTEGEVSPSASGSGDRFFCAGESPVAMAIISGKSQSPGSSESDLQMPTVGELVRGAFSPWKIPDRGDDNESSIASSSRMLHENEMYSKAAVAATTAIRSQNHGLSDGNKEDNNNLNESFEVSIEEESGEGSLTSVLRWLFKEVLPSKSSIVAAFSAFDINTATTVQCGRILAIVNDDESFNIICRHVATSVMKQYGNAKVDPVHAMSDVPRQIGDEDESVSTYESSIITTSSVSENKQPAFSERAAARILKQIVDPFQIPPSVDDVSVRGPSPDVLAANFVGFLQQISNLTGIQSPFDGNPFLNSVVDASKNLDLSSSSRRERKTLQDLVFPNEDRLISIFQFLHSSCKKSGVEEVKHVLSVIEEQDTIDGNKNIVYTTLTPVSKETTASLSCIPSDHQAKTKSTVRKSNKSNRPRKGPSPHKQAKAKGHHRTVNPNYIVPDESPSPFETAVWNQPNIVPVILSFLGNPVAVCAMKRLNVFCNRIVCENQHVLMRDAVRLGGMSKYVRPSFWLWVTEMNKTADPIPIIQSRQGFEPRGNAPTSTPSYKGNDFLKLKESGANGKWQHIIERDVTRAFGNMPPHKTGARYRQDSIVTALVSFGREEIMRNSRSYQAMDKLPEETEAKHFKLSSRLDRDRRDDSSSVTPTDTVSDWGGISPVGSLISEDPSKSFEKVEIAEESMRVVSYENSEILEASTQPLKLNLSQRTSKSDVSDPVLSGNALTSEMKVDLQDKLRSILHALAARHEGVGYCQGMDYVVAHLLRVLQDTILLRVVQRSMPGQESEAVQDSNDMALEVEDWRTISSDELRARMSDINTHSVVVEEVVFRVMDTFFSTYNLQHMYWPELRCLKTCCRVFESLIEQKLPVLADHFQHHDLNVGLFALGWFQTLFLYLPSMPSTTVCHIWDIWLVERSFKIFFRIGTAILFLSQPTLLNHDLEGMMTYLNTFPDATLLRRDILIPCALQIKITNRMLVEIEMEVARFDTSHHPSHYHSY